MAWVRSPGRWLQIVGVAHLLYGLVDFRSAWAQITANGFCANVPDRGEEATTFWFPLGAPLMWTTGQLLRRAEDADDRSSQRAAGIVITGTGLTCAALNPVSPFWVVAAIGAAALRRAAPPTRTVTTPTR